MLVGAGGIGKTSLMQSWATSMATGAPYIGAVVEPVPVLRLSCEDPHDELWRP